LNHINQFAIIVLSYDFPNFHLFLVPCRAGDCSSYLGVTLRSAAPRCGVAPLFSQTTWLRRGPFVQLHHGVCRPFVWLHHGGAGLYPNAFGLKILKVSWIFPSNPSLGSSFAIAALGLDERSVGGEAEIRDVLPQHMIQPFFTPSNLI
jgi:hypothetical protein